jgi:hypothetical protein
MLEPNSNGEIVYEDQGSFSNDTGIELDIIQLCKKCNAPGFTDGRRINWTIFKPWYEQHKDLLLSINLSDYNESKTRLMTAKADREEIKLAEDKRNTLNKTDVISFLKSISAAQSNLLISKLSQELPPKLLGLDVDKMRLVMIDTAYEIINIMKEPIDKWK